MPFIDMPDGKGGLQQVHINLGHKRNREFKHCKFCLREGRRWPGSFLCDTERKGAYGTIVTTCDAAMCDKHAKEIGTDKHICPDCVGGGR